MSLLLERLRFGATKSLFIPRLTIAPTVFPKYVKTSRSSTWGEAAFTGFASRDFCEVIWT